MALFAFGLEYSLRKMQVCPILSKGSKCPVLLIQLWHHRLMRINNTSRRISILTAMGMLLLACAVFGWGLQYKMSLYGPLSGLSHSTPEAKLLSEKERPASRQDNASIRPAFTQPQTSMLPALLLIAILAMRLRHLVMKWMQAASVQTASRHQRRAYLNYFSFRPPPASILSY
jgi:hypothetical protein